VLLPARFFQARDGWKDLEAKKLPEYLRPPLQTMKGVYEHLTQAIRHPGKASTERKSVRDSANLKIYEDIRICQRRFSYIVRRQCDLHDAPKRAKRRSAGPTGRPPHGTQ
jgi:hypothetical protein